MHNLGIGFANESNQQILIVLSKSNTLNYFYLMQFGIFPEKAHVFNINLIERLENQIDPIVELISTLQLNSRLENE